MEKYIEKIKTNKKFFILLAVIMAAGIFLRTYQHADLLRFGKDQARDAGIIRDIIEKKQPLPLLGPRAYGTEFKMGPIFYYFQYASAKIFGVSPNKMAYPDLFFSILTIPVLFLFLRKYFDRNISLALAALYAVSFFAVQNGRFAWNPNSLPLFSMLFLYALAELADPEGRKHVGWAIVGGISLGVGVQLHTLFILIMGAIFIIYSVYFFKKRYLSLKNIGIILAIALFLNLPQLVSEIKTDGQNSKAFFSGVTQKSEKRNIFPRNVIINSAWHAQANTMFVYPSGDDSKSQFESLEKKILSEKKKGNKFSEYYSATIKFALGVIFSILGYALLGFYLKKEEDEKKKTFLKIIALYVSVSFFVLIPLSHVLVLRYFLMLQFIPILMIGLILKLAQDKLGEKIYYFLLIFVLVLMAFNVSKLVKELQAFRANKGDVGIAIWSEEKFAGDFILSHSKPNQKIYFISEPQNANKFIRSLSYFNESIDAPVKYNDSTPLDEKDTAYFSLILDTKKERKQFSERMEKAKLFEVTDSSSYGRLKIMKLKFTQ